MIAVRAMLSGLAAYVGTFVLVSLTVGSAWPRMELLAPFMCGVVAFAVHALLRGRSWAGRIGSVLSVPIAVAAYRFVASLVVGGEPDMIAGAGSLGIELAAAAIGAAVTMVIGLAMPAAVPAGELVR